MVSDSRILYVFDLDKTLLTKNASFLFYNYLLEKGVFPLSLKRKAAFYHIMRKCRLFSMEQFHEKVFQVFLQGTPFTSIDQHAEDFVEKVFEEVVCPKIGAFLNKAQKEEQKILLLSTSPDFLVGRFAKRFGISTWSSSSYLVDKENRFSKIATTMTGALKAKTALSYRDTWGISKEAIYAFSDSSEDEPLLRLASTAYVIRPNRRLKNMQKKRGWILL